MLNNKQYIYVVLTQTGTMVSKTIKAFTRTPFNHVSITTDKELSEMFSFSRFNKYRPLPAGFKNESVHTGVYGLFSSIPCEIYSFEVTDSQLKRYNDLITHFKTKTQLYSYNLLGLLTVPLGIPLKRRTRFVCSQFVAYMLTYSGIAKFNKDISLITPDDFRYLKNATLLYSGDMKQYTYSNISQITL